MSTWLYHNTQNEAGKIPSFNLIIMNIYFVKHNYEGVGFILVPSTTNVRSSKNIYSVLEEKYCTIHRLGNPQQIHSKYLQLTSCLCRLFCVLWDNISTYRFVGSHRKKWRRTSIVSWNNVWAVYDGFCFWVMCGFGISIIIHFLTKRIILCVNTQ